MHPETRSDECVMMASVVWMEVALARLSVNVARIGDRREIREPSWEST